LIKTTAILFVFLFTSSISLAQQNNNWYFGQRAGISFTNPMTQQPLTSSLPDGMMIADEGSSSISDSTGKLLFYTNGVTVYNKLQQAGVYVWFIKAIVSRVKL